MKLQIYTVDAFTDKPFSGNPAAVVPLLKPLEEETMQKVAAEMNLSETAYVQPVISDTAAKGVTTTNQDPLVTGSRFSLRWFTPTNEVNLCGHATLATAHVLYRCLGNTSPALEFETKSGVLVAKRNGPLLVLDFPANPPRPLTPVEEGALGGLVGAATGGLKVQEVQISPATKKLLIRLHSSCTRQQLETLVVDSGAWYSVHDGSIVKGVILTLKGEVEGTTPNPTLRYHCLSRYFAPYNGIPEDPVTGSAHTVLGPYWSKELGISTLNCRQVSPRGGEMVVTVREDGRVDLAGSAITVLEGTLHI